MAVSALTGYVSGLHGCFLESCRIKVFISTTHNMPYKGHTRNTNSQNMRVIRFIGKPCKTQSRFSLQRDRVLLLKSDLDKGDVIFFIAKVGFLSFE